MWLIHIVILSLVAYRVTHFLIEDTLIDTLRLHVHAWILGHSDRPAAWREKLYELVQCYWCLGMWVSAGVVCVADQYLSIPLPWLTILAVAQGAMLVSVPFAVVNDDEE